MHVNTVCSLASYIFVKEKKSLLEERTEYLFTSGYDGRINVWEIFEKKSLV